MCPFHSAALHLAHLRSLAIGWDVQFESLPLFPDGDGHEISKIAAVETFVAIARLGGVKTHDTHGRSLFGGHCFRTGSAVALTSLGLDSLKIECLARWHSPMLAHYARLAPLRTLTQEYKAKALAADSRDGTNLITERLAKLQLVVDGLVIRLDREELVDETSESHLLSDTFVLNCVSDIWHLSAAHDSMTDKGKTICKWEYSRHNSIQSSAEPFASLEHTFCNRCLPRSASASSHCTHCADRLNPPSRSPHATHGSPAQAGASAPTRSRSHPDARPRRSAPAAPTGAATQPRTRAWPIPSHTRPSGSGTHRDDQARAESLAASSPPESSSAW